MKYKLDDFSTKLGLVEVFSIKKANGNQRGKFLVGVPLNTNIGSSKLFLSTNPAVRKKGYKFLGKPTLKKKFFQLAVEIAFYFKIKQIISFYTWQSNSIFEFILSKLSGELFFNCYLGTPGPYSKPVIQICNSQGEEKFYVKIALTERVKQTIKNEIFALNWISAFNNKPFIHPEIILTDTWQNNLFMIQSAVPFRQESNSETFTDFHLYTIQWFKERLNTKKVFFISSYYKTLTNYLNQIPLHIKEIVILALQQFLDKKILFHPSHGDFAPWNSFFNKKNNKLILIDWEYFSLERPAGWDIFHFFFRVEFFLKKKKAQDLIADINFWNKLQFFLRKLYPDIKNFDIYLLIYLIDRLVFHSSVKSPNKKLLEQYEILLKYFLLREPGLWKK